MKASPDGRRGRRLALWIGGGVVLLVALAAAAAAALYPPSRLTPLVRDGLAGALHAPVSLRRASLTLLPWPGARLDDLAVGDPAGYRRPAAWPRGGLLAARSAHATVALLPLLARRLELRRLDLDGVRVTAVRNEQGVGNWEGLGGPPDSTRRPAAPGFDLTLQDVRLSGARVEYFDGASGAYLDLGRVDARVAVETRQHGHDQRARGTIEVRGIAGRQPWPVGARPVRLLFDVESAGGGAHWVVRTAALERGRLKLSGHGTVEGPGRILDFRLDQSSIPLADALELLPRDQVAALGRLSGAGTIRLALEARGPLSGGRVPAVRARAKLDGGALRFADRGIAIEDLVLDLRATEQGADLDRLSGRVGRSVFELSGLARDWADPRLRVRARANLDLAEVTRFLPLADSTRLGGRVRVDAQGAGRLPQGGRAAAAAPDFGWSGRVDLAGVSAAGVGLGYPVSGISGQVGLSPGRAWATGLTARLGDSDATLDLAVERPFAFAAAASGRSPHPDPAAMARFALRSRSLDGDRVFPQARNDQPLPPVRAEGTFAIGEFRMRRFAGRNLAGRVRYANGVAAIDDAVADAYGGRVRGTAWFDLTDRATPRYQVHASAESLSADALLTAWTPARDLAFGRLQLSMDLNGSGLEPQAIARSLTVRGLAEILGGKLAGATALARIAEFTGVDRFRLLSFRDLWAPFRVERGRVVFDPIAIATGGTDWLAQGSVGLDGTLDFHVAALVPAAEVPALPPALARGAGAALGADGRLALDLRVTGPAANPRVGWDSGRTASRLLAGSGGVQALARRLGVNLADSLASGRGGIGGQAQALVEQQQQRLNQEVERQKEDLARHAVDELTSLFDRPARRAPPPPDSAAADTTARDTAAAGGP